jgi:hypothetical protein
MILDFTTKNDEFSNIAMETLGFHHVRNKTLHQLVYAWYFQPNIPNCELHHKHL